MKKKHIAILVSTLVLAIIVVLVVLFNIKTYIVAFDSAGGSFVPTEKVKVFKQVTRPDDPTKDGYTFDNWYYNDGIFDFSTRITQDMTLEARWIEGGPVPGTYVVSFNSNGGSSIASIRSNTDGTVNQPDDPVREGYKFVSWQYNGEDFDFESTIKSNMTLVAKWEKNEGGGSESVPAEKVTLSPTRVDMKVGNSRRITVALAPAEATNRPMTWTTSNSRVATVSSTGNIVAVGVGTAVITVKVDGLTATVTVNVQAAAQVPPTPSNPTTPTNPSNPSNPGSETPPAVDPKPKVTYSYYFEAEPSSSLGQGRLRIKSSEGKFVSGVLKVTYTDGYSENVNVGPTGGELYYEAEIKSATVISPK